jgi:hypothetical protein
MTAWAERIYTVVVFGLGFALSWLIGELGRIRNERIQRREDPRIRVLLYGQAARGRWWAEKDGASRRS